MTETLKININTKYKNLFLVDLVDSTLLQNNEFSGQKNLKLIEITELNKYRDTELRGLAVRPNLQFPSCMPLTDTFTGPSQEESLVAHDLRSLSWSLTFQKQLFLWTIDKVNFGLKSFV
jgi:hypothetical protein